MWFVPESELAQYEAEGLEVVGVPAAIRGITATRNWILDNVPDRWVVMVDDDAKTVGWAELMSHRSHARKLKGSAISNCFGRLFEITEGLGWKIWGAKTEAMLMGVFPYRPFIWHTYLTASCMGLVNDGSYRFDESFPVKEDYEIGLRHLAEFGGVVAARFFHWQNHHWGGNGGCGAYRTQAMEDDCIARLMKMYPGWIARVKRKGTGYAIEVRV